MLGRRCSTGTPEHSATADAAGSFRVGLVAHGPLYLRPRNHLVERGISPVDRMLDVAGSRGSVDGLRDSQSPWNSRVGCG